MLRRLIFTLLPALALLAGVTPAVAQRPDGLDQPLLAANLCGAGDGAETHFTLAATGDSFPHENIQAVGEAQGYGVLFDYVRPYLQAADLAYTNFDGAMLEGAGYSGYPNFNFNPALATALREAGISLVSTANNHILDRGPEGLDATLAVLEANGIRQHGAVRSDAIERPPYLPITLQRGDVSLRIGFISASWGTNGIPDPYGQVNLLYASNAYGEQGGVRQSVLDAVALAAAETDLVVVAAHWGFEYQFYPHESQLEAARRLAEAGADVILGAQPHTLQPVEVIDTGGRKTLVFYSLANFLASQGALQAQSYAATSAIFYIGIARAADGTVRLTGYRYLPTIHVDADTRPAAILPGSADEVIAHVRTILRDPGGLRQLPAEVPAPGTIVNVCPPLTLAETPTTPIPGDFAQHYLTLGGVGPRPLTDAINGLGLPLGAVQMEPAGDCTTTVPVLYSERQRLELHSGQAWPYRVVGSQLGALAFARRYPGIEPTRRTDLAAPDAFADSRFRSFYEQFGGLTIFGYPISGPLNEDHPESGVPTTVQYFERARFELAPTVDPGAPLTDQVRLGLLGRELRDAGGAAALCGAGGLAVPLAPTNGSPTPTSGAMGLPAFSGEDLALVGDVASQAARSAGSWIPLIAVLALLLAILALVGIAVNDWRGYRRRGTRRGYRRRRSAYERFAPPPAPVTPLQAEAGPPVRPTVVDPVPAAPPTTAEVASTATTSPVNPAAAPPVAPSAAPAPPDDDDELLRQLLGY